MTFYYPNKYAIAYGICCWLFAISTLLGSSPIPTTSVHMDTAIQSIENNIYWLTDSSNQWTYDFVKHQNFHPFNVVEGFTFNPYHAYWFQFSLKNNSTTDTLVTLLCTGNYTNITLYTEKNQPLEGGNRCSFQDRAFRENGLCFPLKITPNKSQLYYLKLYNFSRKSAQPLPLLLKSYPQERLERTSQFHTVVPKYLFFGLFSGVIFILLFYSTFQYWGTKDKAFLFYAVYLASLYIYQLRNFEHASGWNIPILFAYHMELRRTLEVFLEYSSYIFYILFIQHFLNLAKDSTKINKGLTISVWCLIGFIILDFIFQWTLGLRTSITLHNYIRTLFFIPAFWLVFHIFFNQKNKLYKYVFIGTTLLVFSSIYTLLGQLFPIERYNALGGAIKVYVLGDHQIYMYHMRTGVLLEIICFAFGLSYKNSQQWKNYLALNEKVAQQNLQIQKITNTPTQNENAPDELLQKIAILLEENYQDLNFGTKSLANLLHMSRSKLTRQLKSRDQLSPSNLIRQYRLEKARNLILTTNLTLAEIAHLTGFNEATYFSKSFKDYYQMSPSELRLTQ